MNISGFFQNIKQTETQKFAAWENLITLAKKPQAVNKKDAWCISSQVSGKKTLEAVLKVNSMSLCWVDIDDNNLSIETIKEKLAVLELNSVIIYSTASSMRLNKNNELNGKRWRILIELLKPVDCEQWVLIQQAISEQLGGDKSALRIQQILFAPNNPEISDPRETRHYEYIVMEGDPLDPDNLPYELDSHIAWLKDCEDKFKLESIKAIQLRPQSSNTGGFTFEDANKMLPSISDLLVNYGNKKQGRNKYLSVNSQSGIAGIIVYVDHWISHHESDSDIGVKCSTGTCGDAFDLYCHYEHAGDKKKALAELAKNDPQNKQRQRDFMNNQRVNSEQNNKQAPEPAIQKQELHIQKFNWNMFSLNNQSKAMRQQMLDDKYILNGMALMGQHTVFYAPPNAGKTLITIHQIIESIKDNNFKPDDLMYVNADDTYKGLVTKLELAEQYGFQMVAPGHNNFRAGYLIPMLHEFINLDTAKNKIIVLDTLKKFTDLMDKKASSDFSNTSRAFTTKGGSIISLAHVNKNKNSDGKSIKAGTSDISDDADCVYIIDAISDGDEKVVEFRNDKDRGDVDKVVTFSYDQTEKFYPALLDSVKRIDKNQASDLKRNAKGKQFLSDNKYSVGLIKELIFSGVLSQKEIISNLNEFHGVSQAKAKRILAELCGIEWTYKSKDKNRYEYRLIKKYESTPVSK